MGVETIKRADNGETGTTGHGHVVSRHLVSRVERDDTPPDGGWGFSGDIISEAEVAWTEYKRKKLAEILGGKSLPLDCEVVWDAHVSYAGEGPEPHFEGPSYRGRVIYEQDNSRPPENRMVPSIEWTKLGNRLDVPV